MAQPKILLITGATGKQGGSVIDALLKEGKNDFTILALTRNAQSAGAKRLESKSPLIKLVEGDLDDVPSVFRAAVRQASPIWGVYSVQALGKRETEQGTAMVDEAVKAGVSHFVYSSVDRGGESSWSNPTPVPHFQSKHKIEHYLKEKATGSPMGWTILRPVAFMDNLEPGFFGKVFITALRDSMRDKPLQWVATSDIGDFAARAFREPDSFNHRAISLAGDEVSFDQLNDAFKEVTGQPVGTTFSFLGSALKVGVKEIGLMIDWFKQEGYRADIQECRRTNAQMTSFKTWLSNSKFAQK